MISGVRRAKGLQEQLQYLKEILREQRKDTTGGVGRVPQEGGGMLRRRAEAHEQRRAV